MVRAQQPDAAVPIFLCQRRPQSSAAPLPLSCWREVCRDLSPCRHPKITRTQKSRRVQIARLSAPRTKPRRESMPDTLMRDDHFVQPTISATNNIENDPVIPLYTKWLDAVGKVRAVEDAGRGLKFGTPENKASEEALNKACQKRCAIEDRIAKLHHGTPLGLLAKLIVADLQIHENNSAERGIEERVIVSALEDVKILFADLFQRLRFLASLPLRRADGARPTHEGSSFHSCNDCRTECGRRSLAARGIPARRSRNRMGRNVFCR